MEKGKCCWPQLPITSSASLYPMTYDEEHRTVKELSQLAQWSFRIRLLFIWKTQAFPDGTPVTHLTLTYGIYVKSVVLHYKIIFINLINQKYNDDQGAFLTASDFTTRLFVVVRNTIESKPSSIITKTRQSVISFLAGALPVLDDS